MHTVSKTYLEAFALNDVTRRTSALWRFDRLSGEAKIVGVRDAEVVKDIYTVYIDGKPDTGIEELLCGIEDAFTPARQFILEQQIGTKQILISKEQWAALFRFIAAQLLRTPRAFQGMCDTWSVTGSQYESDTPQRVMVELIQRWILRLARMRGTVAYTETATPFLTSDNPAVMWKPEGDAFAYANQRDAKLTVTCPLSPSLLFCAFQTPESLKAVHGERNDLPHNERPSEKFRSNLDFGSIPDGEVKRLNALCVSNAHRYVYANNCGKPLLTFLRNRFFGKPAPVRARDLQPIGSPSKSRIVENDRVGKGDETHLCWKAC